MKKRVLLVEDEEGLLVALTDRLEHEGYDVQGAADGQAGYEKATREPFDLLVLDVRLPGKDGFAVCRELRTNGSRLPILMLTARGEVVDRVHGLKVGADDYLLKPFEPSELLARMEALLRRTAGGLYASEPEAYEFDLICVDFASERVLRNRVPLALLPREYKLLRYFIEHRDIILTRDRLLDEVWGYDATPTTRTVDVHVAGLRQKIEPHPQHPRYLLTIHRRGYKFVG
jgi:two-component system, OmpR family, alkaline phosphatase synthesis response regulator PhoP